MLMTFDESINACKNIDDWKFVTSFSVGGFEWTGFSKENPNKLRDRFKFCVNVKN